MTTLYSAVIGYAQEGIEPSVGVAVMGSINNVEQCACPAQHVVSTAKSKPKQAVF